MNLEHANILCQHMVVDNLLRSVTRYFFPDGKSSKDGQECKAKSGYDLFQLIHHSFSSFKVCHEC